MDVTLLMQPLRQENSTRLSRQYRRPARGHVEGRRTVHGLRSDR